MAIAALSLAVLALFVALAARGRAAGFARRIDDTEREARRRLENAVLDLSGELATTRRLLAELAAGRALDEEMILEGRLWRETDAAEAQRMLALGGVALVDVRTKGEVAGGRIPGALHLPLDELEARRDELPRDGRTVLVYCAGGGRSAAACEFLAREGFSNLFNLSGGIQSWTGVLERG